MSWQPCPARLQHKNQEHRCTELARRGHHSVSEPKPVKRKSQPAVSTISSAIWAQSESHSCQQCHKLPQAAFQCNTMRPTISEPTKHCLQGVQTVWGSQEAHSRPPETRTNLENENIDRKSRVLRLGQGKTGRGKRQGAPTCSGAPFKIARAFSL